MAQIHLKIFIRFLAGFICIYALSASAEAVNPHLVSNTERNDSCLSCHSQSPQLNTTTPLETKNKPVFLAEFKNDGVAMCTGCHDADDGHKIGLKLDFEVPADLPLDKKQALSCLTCHYTHGKLESDRPQASHSIIDKLVNSERLHKSFLLRRNNVDGELCLICHNANQGKK